MRPSGKHLKKKPIRSWSFVVLADAQEQAAAARSDEQIAVEQIGPSTEHRFLRDAFSERPRVWVRLDFTSSSKPGSRGMGGYRSADKKVTEEFSAGLIALHSTVEIGRAHV